MDPRVPGEQHPRDPQCQAEQDCKGNKGGRRSICIRITAKIDLTAEGINKSSLILYTTKQEFHCLLSASSPENAPMKRYSQVTSSEKS